jgi:hypothetical protein
MKWLRGRFPCADQKLATLCSLWLSGEPRSACNNHNGHDGEQSENGQRSEVGEGLLMPVCKHRPKMGKSHPSHTQFHSTYPSSFPSFPPPAKKAMAARTISRLAPALANLRAGASLAQRSAAFRSFATEAGNNSVRVSSTLTFAEPCLIFIR